MISMQTLPNKLLLINSISDAFDALISFWLLLLDHILLGLESFSIYKWHIPHMFRQRNKKRNKEDMK